jgi:hypothetical protein
MFLLSDIITYVRRIVKTPSNSALSDNLIIDYINRFWITDVDARVQLFDLKTKYSFQTTPGIDQYNMPLYSVQTQPGNQIIASFPVYQGFMTPCFVAGIQVPFYTDRNSFFNQWPNYVQTLPSAGTADGVSQTYSLPLPFFPALAGHIDINGIITSGATSDPPVVSSFLTNIPTTSVYSAVYITATGSDGSNVVIADSGQFLLSNVGYGLLMQVGQAPFGNQSLGTYSTTSNTVNYANGTINVTFPVALAAGTSINVQSYFYEQGIPRAILYFNNSITLRPPSNIPYLVEMDAYLSPAAFLNTGGAIPFGYMAEYIARGAARKILADTGDTEQFMFYEPLFKEQETLVWKRSQRQFTATRTGTIFSELQGQNQSAGSNIGGT